MQKTTFHFLGLLFVAFLTVFATGCGDDPITTPNDLPPTITLAPDAGFVSFSQDIPFATPTFNVRVNVNDGDSPLRSIRVAQDGTNLPTDNLDWDNGSISSQNPLLIQGADQSGTSYDITIRPLNPAANSSSTFTFEVTDEANRRAETSITITFTATPATVTFGSDGLQDNQDRNVNAASFRLQVLASQGNAPLTSIAFYQNDALLSNEEIIVVAAGTALPSNPAALGSISNLDDLFELRPNTVAAGPTTFRVDVTDALGVTGSQFIIINYVVPSVTEINGVLLNQAGPAGTGGLDLDNGTSVGSNNAAAEIQDEGIDTNLPAATNWRRQISAANDAELRVVELSQLPDNFSFANVTSLDQVIQAFNTGSTPDGDDTITSGTDTVTGEIVSRPVIAGDLFAIKRGDNYYLIRIDAVNVLENSNGDNYEISIKK